MPIALLSVAIVGCGRTDSTPTARVERVEQPALEAMPRQISSRDPIDRGAPRRKWHVLDEVSRAELTGVEIIDGLSSYKREFIHPGTARRSTTLVAQESSPLAPRFVEDLVCWIRADGHAWKRFQLDDEPKRSELDMDTEMSLLRACEIEVELENFRAKTGTSLRIYVPSGDASAWPASDFVPADDGHVGIESLAPGRYELRAEIGGWDEAHEVLGSTIAEVHSGDSLHLRIELSDLPAILPPAPLEGTLSIDGDPGDQRIDLWVGSLIPFVHDMDDDSYSHIGGGRFHGHDLHRWDQSVGSMFIEWSAMQPVDGDSGTRHWKVGQVRPGRYRLRARPFGVERIVEVGATGVTDVAIAVATVKPELSTLSIRLVNPRTGRDDAVKSLHWSRTISHPAAGSDTAVKLDESTRRFAWELEMGYVRIYADTGEGHAALDSILFVGAGSNEVELELPRD